MSRTQMVIDRQPGEQGAVAGGDEADAALKLTPARLRAGSVQLDPPESGVIRPAATRSRVVLPLPLRP